MSSTYKPVDVPPSLQKLNVNKMGREKQTFCIEFLFPTLSADAEDMPVLVMFDIKQDFAATMEQFKKKAKKSWQQLTPQLVERVIAALAGDEYCRKILQYYETDAEDSDELPEIGEANKSKYGSNPDEQVETYASSASDPDYDDEKLPLFSVTNALRKNQMRMRVHGVIDSIGKLFKLATRVFFICTNPKCPACGKRELKVLDRPVFQDADIQPIGFRGDYKEYRNKAKCPRCNEMRACQPDMREFANVKVIELKNTSSDKVSVLTANPELATEGLTTVVFNKHTLALGLGEDVEIVGQFYVVESGLAASRYGNGRRGNRTSHTDGSYKSP
jgi:hypothetical protein